MRAPIPSPVRCNVCDECLCYCSKRYELEGELKNDEISKLRIDIEEIRKREEYLHNLREYLEKNILHQ
jgi:hypothetical protein